MTFSNTVLATASLVAFATPSRAFEPLTFGDFSLLLGGGVNLTATHDAETTSNAYGYLESTLAFKYDFGPLTFGIEAYSELEFDSDAEGRNLAVYDDPYVDLGLWIEGESFGYLSYSYEVERHRGKLR